MAGRQLPRPQDRNRLIEVEAATLTQDGNRPTGVDIAGRQLHTQPPPGREQSHRSRCGKLSNTQQTAQAMEALLRSHLLPTYHSGLVSRETDEVRSIVKSTGPPRQNMETSQCHRATSTLATRADYPLVGSAAAPSSFHCHRALQRHPHPSAPPHPKSLWPELCRASIISLLS